MENKESSKSFFLKRSFRKVYFLIAFSLFGLLGLFYVLNRITAAGENISAIKKEAVSESDLANFAFLETELAHYKDQISDLTSLFADDSKVILFLQEINRLKREGVVESYSIVSDSPIKDKSGNFGFPTAITFRGSEEQVDAALRNIQSLGFLLRGVQAEVSREVDEAGGEVVVLEYGGFLYVENN